MTTATLLAAAALCLGLLYSLTCLVSPRFAARSVRLQADPARSGGYAEFRATFGGVFGGLHLSALLFLLLTGTIAGAVAAGVVASGWLGAAFGRFLAIIFDRNAVRNISLNAKLILLELIMGLAIAAPLLQVWFSN